MKRIEFAVLTVVGAAIAICAYVTVRDFSQVTAAPARIDHTPAVIDHDRQKWFDAHPPVDEGYDESSWSGTNTEAVCMAIIILAEAGGEPIEGQIAVGQVMVNRQRIAGPTVSICNIAEAPGQFAYGKKPMPHSVVFKSPQFRQALFLANAVIANRATVPDELQIVDATGGATCFTSAPGAKGDVRIGAHVFRHCIAEAKP